MERMNWTAIIMTGFTVFVGLTCMILALTLGKDNPVATGFLFTTAGAAFGAFFKQPQTVGKDREQADNVTPISRDKQAGYSRIFVVCLLVAVSALSWFVLAASKAHADTQTVDQTTQGNWKQRLTVGAVATMIDLKSGAVELGAPLGMCWGLEYLPYKSGAAACGHFALSTKDAPNRYVGSLQLNYRGVAGIGLGVMKRQGEAGWPLVLYLSGAVPIL